MLRHISLDNCNNQYDLQSESVVHFHNVLFFHVDHNNTIEFPLVHTVDRGQHDTLLGNDVYRNLVVHHRGPNMKILLSDSLYQYNVVDVLSVHNNK